MTEPRDELLELARSARAWVEWMHDSGVEQLYQPRRSSATAPRAPAQAPVEAGVEARRSPAPSEASPDVQVRLRTLAEQAAGCVRCGLHQGRTRSVFGRGAMTAEVVFVGEGPGYH
ncbi:MAG: hypothetical protein AAGA56_21820, partial [Myxococcota bacterium]